MITLEIPCKKYVKKYLIAKYGDSHQISKNTLLGLLTLELLEKDFDPNDYPIKFDAIYSVIITERYVYGKGVSISSDKLNVIGSSMERLFREDLFAHVDLAILTSGFKALDSIRKFLKYYKITDDELNLESIYKAYKRHKNFDIKGHVKKNAGNPYKQRSQKGTFS